MQQHSQFFQKVGGYLAVFLWLNWLIITPSASASLCHRSNNHTICILNIKRSAKYYWEYRASVSIDGVKRPREIYHCRDRTKIRSDKSRVPFTRNGAGELICRRFKS